MEGNSPSQGTGFLSRCINDIFYSLIFCSLCVCVHVCTLSHMCSWIQAHTYHNSEINTKCFPQYPLPCLFVFFFETQHLSEPGACYFNETG